MAGELGRNQCAIVIINDLHWLVVLLWGRQEVKPGAAAGVLYGVLSPSIENGSLNPVIPVPSKINVNLCR